MAQEQQQGYADASGADFAAVKWAWRGSFDPRLCCSWHSKIDLEACDSDDSRAETQVTIGERSEEHIARWWVRVGVFHLQSSSSRRLHRQQ